MTAKVNLRLVVAVQTIILFILLLYIFSRESNVVSQRKTSFDSQNPRFSKTRGELTRLELLTNYDDSFYEQFDSLVARKAQASDPEAVQLVKEILDPPSFLNTYKLSRSVEKTLQAEAVDDIFNGKRNGFFVEVGGFDGERSSNTLFFEHTRYWSGLLVEADPFFYAQLLGKNRRCWSINACMSPTNYVTKLTFQESDTGRGKIMDSNKKGGITVPCFPFETFMLALEVADIDFFSLDIEGFELKVLKTIDFKKFNIKTLAVEYLLGNKEEYETFMMGNDYKVNKTLVMSDAEKFVFVEDFIFVKNNL